MAGAPDPDRSLCQLSRVLLSKRLQILACWVPRLLPCTDAGTVHRLKVTYLTRAYPHLHKPRGPRPLRLARKRYLNLPIHSLDRENYLGCFSQHLPKNKKAGFPRRWLSIMLPAVFTHTGSVRTTCYARGACALGSSSKYFSNPFFVSGSSSLDTKCQN